MSYHDEDHVKTTPASIERLSLAFHDLGLGHTRRIAELVYFHFDGTGEIELKSQRTPIDRMFDAICYAIDTLEEEETR